MYYNVMCSADLDLGIGYSGVFLHNPGIWVFWGILFGKTPCHVAWERCFVIIFEE